MENNLDIDVKNAKALGLSYGQYKALTYKPDTTPTKTKKGVKVPPVCEWDVLPPKICPICGKNVLHPRIKFCSDQCFQIHNKEYHRKRNLSRCRMKYGTETKEGE